VNNTTSNQRGDQKKNLSSIAAVDKNNEHEPAVTVEEAVAVFEDFLTELYRRLKGEKEGESNYHIVHGIYHDVTVEKLLPFDEHYQKHMPQRRNDNSIFLSIASYRDENCVNTITQAYAKSLQPNNLNVGLVQQNCVRDCMSGVLQNGEVEHSEPDEDCYQVFCDSEIGKPHCEANRVRVLKVEESASLGPYTARYFASKLWNGESWFMQIDSHSTFSHHWDDASVEMLRKAPSEKPVISHYPPASEDIDFETAAEFPAPRMCDATFESTEFESQIVRLGESKEWDRKRLDVPRFAPFVAAGYFVAHADFLKDVPFDPFLPWIFMGEEIIMSARLWTHGYDIFSPTHSVVGHMYVRRNKPKYWESVERFLWQGVDSLVQALVLNRIKYLLGYPESARDVVWPKTVYTAVENYGMGNVRAVEDYMKMVGLDPVRKEVWMTDWCRTGQPPDHAKDVAYLYDTEESRFIRGAKLHIEYGE